MRPVVILILMLALVIAWEGEASAESALAPAATQSARSMSPGSIDQRLRHRATTTTAPTTDPTDRRVRRPELSEAEYKALADRLRLEYSKPTSEWPKPTIDAGVKFAELGLLSRPTFPKDNPFTEAKAQLGKQLFFDPRLSGSGAIACASCHDPDLAWADGRTVAFGHDRQANKRNAPSIMNAGYHDAQFWDGRADSLEEQVRMPVVANNEMHGDESVIIKRLADQPDYRKTFKEVFGSEAIDFDRIAQAIATFERTITAGRSAFDKFVSGKSDTLSDSAIRGLNLFRTDARCLNCHSGSNFTDGQFHDVGLSYYGRKFEDLGRFNVSKKAEDVGAFKTPSLRNISRTAPYMHNGLFDLEGVLNMYNAGMATLRRKPEQANDPLFPTKSHLLQPLHLNKQDLADLLAFLKTLEEPRLRIRPPTLPGLDPTTAPSE